MTTLGELLHRLDTDGDVWEVAEELATGGDRSLIPDVRAALDRYVAARDWFARDLLAHVLVGLAGADAFAPLLPLLAVPDPGDTDSLRSTLAQLMWNEPSACRAVVLPLLEDSALHQTALWALGHVVRPDDIPVLTVALASADPAVRRTAVASLPALDADPRVPDLLVAALSDPDAWTRHHAVLGLAWGAPASVADHLIPMTTDTEWVVRSVLGEAIGRLAAGSGRAAAATDALLLLLTDPEPPVRAGAARGLGSLGGARAALSSCATDPDDRVRAAVAVSLAHSDGPESLETLRALASDESSEVRWQLAAALRLCRRPEARELLAQLAADPSPAVREMAKPPTDHHS